MARPSCQQTLATLSEQHDDLRTLLDHCDCSCDEVERTGSREGHPLIRQATLLKEALVRHNQVEESLLRPLLRETDAFGDVRVDHMIDEHLAEHAAVTSALTAVLSIADPLSAAIALREAVAQIRRHMDAEEACFLHEQVLRDDIVSIDAMGG